MDYSNLANLVLNNAASIDATLNILLKKGLITQTEYDAAKQESIGRIKKELEGLKGEEGK